MASSEELDDLAARGVLGNGALGLTWISFSEALSESEEEEEPEDDPGFTGTGAATKWFSFSRISSSLVLDCLLGAVTGGSTIGLALISLSSLLEESEDGCFWSGVAMVGGFCLTRISFSDADSESEDDELLLVNLVDGF